MPDIEKRLDRLEAQHMLDHAFLKQRLEELREDIENHRKDIAIIRSEVARLDGDLTSLENR